MGERAGRFAGLTTRGRCLLAGGGATAVSAVVLDERDLVRVGVFAAILPLLALLLASRTRRTARVDRHLDPGRVSVDGQVTVGLHLHGGGLLGAMRLHDTVPDAAGPQAAAPPRFLVRSSRRAGTALTYGLRPGLRGTHRIGPVVATATDPLGLVEFDQEMGGADLLLVLPRVVPLRGLPPALGNGDGTPGPVRAHQGQGASDVLVRPYRQGDELRRVHWRSSARHDDLMVRLEERPWRSGITVLLDRRDSAHRGSGARSSLEFAVSLTASICAHLIAHGEPVVLVTEEGSVLTGQSTAPGIDPMLDTLAALRPSAWTDLTGPELRRGTDVLAVLGALGPGQIEGLLARRPTGGHAVLLDVVTWDPGDGPGTQRRAVAGRPAHDLPDSAASTADSTADSTAAMLRRAGWRVAVARATSTPDRVWDELTSGAAPGGVRAGTP